LSATGVMNILNAPLIERTVIAMAIAVRSTPKPLANVLRNG